MPLGTGSPLAGSLREVLPLPSAHIKLISESRKDLLFASILPSACLEPRGWQLTPGLPQALPSSTSGELKKKKKKN